MVVDLVRAMVVDLVRAMVVDLVSRSGSCDGRRSRAMVVDLGGRRSRAMVVDLGGRRSVGRRARAVKLVRWSSILSVGRGRAMVVDRVRWSSCDGCRSRWSSICWSSSSCGQAGTMVVDLVGRRGRAMVVDRVRWSSIVVRWSSISLVVELVRWSSRVELVLSSCDGRRAPGMIVEIVNHQACAVLELMQSWSLCGCQARGMAVVQWGLVAPYEASGAPEILVEPGWQLMSHNTWRTCGVPIVRNLAGTSVSSKFSSTLSPSYQTVCS